MNRSVYGHLRVVVIAALTAAGCAAQVESAEGTVASTGEALSSCGPPIPALLEVPEGNKLSFTWLGVGTQIYDCKAGADGSVAWVFRAPEAELFGRWKRIAGSHYAGPTWEALDGSTVVASRLEGVTVDPKAIPWLLLQATSQTGDGRMSKVTFIQRLHTSAGLAPSTGCDADHLGAVADVDYSATYAFFAARGGVK